MTLLGGALIFLATLIQVIANIWRWSTQRGVQRLVIMVCSALIALAFFVTAFIGLLCKWDLNLVSVFVLMYAIFVALSFAVPGGVPTRLEVVVIAFTLSSLAAVVALTYTTIKLEPLLRASIKQASPPPSKAE
jgi:hypothetical protein